MSRNLVCAVLALSATASVTGCAFESVEDLEENVAESEDRLLAGRRVSQVEIAQAVRNAGFPESKVGTMVCTAKYESSFYQRASNRNRGGSIDRGLFQINSVHLGGTRGCPGRGQGESLYDINTNAKCAYAVYKLQGNRAWYGYRKHKRECDSYRAPSGTANGGNGAGNGAGNGGSQEAGGCWSSTLGDMVEAKTCVQSRSNRIWYQCHSGKWYRGVASGSGPHGACAAAHPL